MQECGVDHVGGRTIGKLSKGYRQGWVSRRP